MSKLVLLALKKESGIIKYISIPADKVLNVNQSETDTYECYATIEGSKHEEKVTVKGNIWDITVKINDALD